MFLSSSHLGHGLAVDADLEHILLQKPAYPFHAPLMGAGCTHCCFVFYAFSVSDNIEYTSAIKAGIKYIVLNVA